MLVITPPHISIWWGYLHSINNSEYSYFEHLCIKFKRLVFILYTLSNAKKNLI